MKNHKVSKALQDVWNWKDACYREVAHLPFREALRKRIQDSERVARELGFAPGVPVGMGFYPTAPARRRQPAVVAEDKPECVTKKGKHN